MLFSHSRASQTKYPVSLPTLFRSRAGDPLQGPRQPVSTILSDVSRCLEGQTTSESNETRTVVSLSKIPSQQRHKDNDRTSVLREKPRKQKDARPKRRNDEAWPNPELPNWGARPWSLAIAEPCRQISSAIQWPSSPRARAPAEGSPIARFDNTFRHFEVFGVSNDL